MSMILYAIPVFMATIVLEAAWAWLKQGNQTAGVGGRSRSIYQFADAVSSLQIGILSRIAAAFPRLLTLGIYILVFDQFRRAPAGLMERKPWAFALESVRWLIAPIIFWLLVF